MMANNDYPRGALFSDKREKLPAIPVAWTLEHGSRAQRRLLKREMKRQKIK